MVTQGYTEGHSRTKNGPSKLCAVLFSESCAGKKQLALATEVESRLYGFLALVVGLIVSDILLSYCLSLLNFKFQYFAQGRCGFIGKDYVLKRNGIFTEVLGIYICFVFY